MTILDRIDNLDWHSTGEAKCIFSEFIVMPDYSSQRRVEKLLMCLVYEKCYDEAVLLAEDIIKHDISGYNSYLFLGIALDLKGKRKKAVWAYNEILSQGLLPKGRKSIQYDQFGIYGLDTEFIEYLRDNSYTTENIAMYKFKRPFERLFHKERIIRRTQHFNIYYFAGSTAENNIDLICEQRETAFIKIAKYMGFDNDIKVDLYLYEDSETKTAETGHTGNGWAYGTVIVELYNDKQRVNPIHELVHIIAGAMYGNSMSVFSEGLAVFLVNKLSDSHSNNAVNDISDRIRTLKVNDELFPIKDLLSLEIGTMESKPKISYLQAASFVKHTIDTLGKNKFFELYSSLKWDYTVKGISMNIAHIQNAFGKNIYDIENEWLCCIV